jgi:hypothetical protein
MKMPVHIGNSPAKKTGTTNKSGVILGLVVIVLVVVNVLGIGLLSQRAMNAIEVVKGIKSTQAFWIAEGGLGMAISYLPNMPETNPFSGTLGNGKYDVTITPVSAYRWTIESVGSVNIVTRRIRVVVGPDVTTAIMLSGNLDIKGNAEVNGVVEEYTTPRFEDVFGVTKEEMQDNATYKYTDPPNNKMPVEKITWINNNFKITASSWVGSGIMIVNGDLTITGGTFNGIIWVTGKLGISVSGNPVINGSIFVEGGATVDSTITGTAEISFDQSAIDAAFSNFITFPVSVSPKPAVLSWQEF